MSIFVLIIFCQSLGKEGKKVIVTDEWRNEIVEKRLEYSLVKVCLWDCLHVTVKIHACMIELSTLIAIITFF